MVIFGGMANLHGSLLGALLLQLARADPDPIDRHRSAEGLLRRAHRLRRVARAVHRPATAAAWCPKERRCGAWLAGHGRCRAASRCSAPKGGRRQWVSRSSGSPKPSRSTWRRGTPSSRVPAAAGRRSGCDRWAQAPITLEVKELTKRFGGIVAADELEHDVAPGRDHSAGRPERRGQDHGVQPSHRVSSSPTGARSAASARRSSASQPDAIARLGMVRTFQDVRLFQRLSCRAERRDRRAAPARRAGAPALRQTGGQHGRPNRRRPTRPWSGSSSSA